MSEQEWYLVERGQQVGPMGRAALIERLRRPGFGPDTLVWTASMTDWAAAGSTELGAALAGPPPVGAPPPPPGASAASATSTTARSAGGYAYGATAGATGGYGYGDDGAAPERWVPFVEAVQLYWQRFATVQGRASRSEYWWAILAITLISLVLTVVDSSGLNGDGIAPGVFSLITLIPSITIGIRRLHDTDRSGWWLLISFVPLIGIVWLLVLLCLPSTPGENRFGP